MRKWASRDPAKESGYAGRARQPARHPAAVLLTQAEVDLSHSSPGNVCFKQFEISSFKINPHRWLGTLELESPWVERATLPADSWTGAPSGRRQPSEVGTPHLLVFRKARLFLRRKEKFQRGSQEALKTKTKKMNMVSGR